MECKRYISWRLFLLELQIKLRNDLQFWIKIILTKQDSYVTIVAVCEKVVNNDEGQKHEKTDPGGLLPCAFADRAAGACGVTACAGEKAAG